MVVAHIWASRGQENYSDYIGLTLDLITDDAVINVEHEGYEGFQGERPVLINTTARILRLSPYSQWKFANSAIQGRIAHESQTWINRDIVSYYIDTPDYCVDRDDSLPKRFRNCGCRLFTYETLVFKPCSTLVAEAKSTVSLEYCPDYSHYRR